MPNQEKGNCKVEAFIVFSLKMVQNAKKKGN